MLKDNILPDIYFGGVGSPGIDWREVADNFDPDDEELAETPQDVIDLLGFDPKEFEEEEKSIGLPTIFKIGTASSGNHGHEGRPGQVGGSGEGGGETDELHKKINLQKSGNSKVDSIIKEVLTKLSPSAISQITGRNKVLTIKASGKIVRTSTPYMGYFGKRYIKTIDMGVHKFKGNEVTVYYNGITKAGLFKNERSGVISVLLHELGHVATRSSAAASPFDEAVANNWAKRYGRKLGFVSGVLEE